MEKVKNPEWQNHLIMCPSQCYCNFEVDGNKYCIYLRWRLDDPWTAQLVPLDDQWEFNFNANWTYLPVHDYIHDDYLKLQKECIQIVNKMFNNIIWHEEKEE